MGLAPFPKKGQHSFIMTSCLFPGRQRGLSKCHSGELQHPQTAAALQMVGGNAVLGTWGVPGAALLAAQSAAPGPCRVLLEGAGWSLFPLCWWPQALGAWQIFMPTRIQPSSHQTANQWESFMSDWVLEWRVANIQYITYHQQKTVSLEIPPRLAFFWFY